MVKRKQEPCPVCGNSLYLTSNAISFKCRYCRRSLEQVVDKRKGKVVVHLIEKKR